jgi:C-terminal processing protease CtpA/Prc
VSEKEILARADLETAARAVRPIRLSRFLKEVQERRGLTREERLRILDQIILLLEMNYVHLPLKRAMHAIDPIQRLKLLKYRLETKRKMEDEMQFHKRLLEIFASLRDIHTRYLLPTPFRRAVAFLPFLVEQYFDTDRKGNNVEKFLVSRLATHQFTPDRSTKQAAAAFKPGVELLYWNGVPIRRAIEINGEIQSGSNLDARFARGLDSLTIRPLRFTLPPDEEWVDITFRDLKNRTRTVRQHWLVYHTTAPPPPAKSSRYKRSSVDVQKTKINQVRRELFAPRDVPSEGAYDKKFYTQVRTVRLKKLGTQKVGYVRLYDFEVGPHGPFVEEFKRVITEAGFPQDGLIIDVRGNPGGRIRAGERLLQLFTPRRIKPELFEFINTPLNLEICQTAPKGIDLERWAESISEAVVTGATYSMGFPLTSEESCNDIGQVYHGPVLLITDALSYSTTDMFAAGFQDNEVGEILGTSDNTGAGGANVWDYDDFMRNARKVSKAPFKPLPRDTNLRIAIRRSIRVGQREGRPLEELGITPNRRYYMTKRDLIGHNEDLIAEATRILRAKPAYSLSVKPVAGKRRAFEIAATSKTQRSDAHRKIFRVDVSANGWPYKSLMAQNGNVPPTVVTFETIKRPANIIVQAFDHNNHLVAALRQR